MFATVLPILRAASRLELSGPAEIADVDPDFRVHFTREGVDAPPLSDDDGNGQPDLVDEIGAALVTYRAEYDAEGWRSVIGDEGADGTNAIDVYVTAIDDYGFAVPVPIAGGASCWLGFDADLPSGAIGASVVAHELHHCVEFRYTDTLASWMYESAATYEQYTHVRDPALDLAAGILYLERLAAPDQKLASAEGRLEYGAFLWTKFWSERTDGGTDSLIAMWEALAEGGGWQIALDRAAEQVHGESLPDLYLEHAVWNAFACGADDGQHYDPEAVPCVVDAQVPATEWNGEPLSILHEEAPYTAAYLTLDSADVPIGVWCEGADRVAVVARDPAGAEAGRVSGFGDQALYIDGAGGPLTVAVAGTTDRALDATCRVLPVEPATCGCRAGVGVGSFGWLAVALIARTRRGHR